ncbi:class I SAM-dependent methyltransferase [Planococcus sp. N064]|uniref:Class I SAM-dependent methyltransferase n=1 Tax=Planococcus liqunii TaxID=3058394 RepID=A0ABT8MTN9_9BACL|nr:class I SAM-dependent methyltransferase [Planococcus sp. N064]MDN7228219.1 class I SAM-dependent methyltransferase [Planococcus sp. N064]
MAHHYNHAHGQHQHKGKVSYLDSPKRRAEFPPEMLLSFIPINAEAAVLDFGAGTGYFSIPAAKLVDGPVYALDLDNSMLEMIRSKAQQKNITNIVPIQGRTDKIPLVDASIDVVIASLVLHEIQPLAPTLTQLKNVLKEGGHLICVELEPKAGPGQHAPRITLAGMEQAITDAGLRITEKYFPAESLYVLIAQKS